MNIDIVNRQISEKLGLRETEVRLVNNFFWRSVYDHLYSYDSRPVDVYSLGVYHPDMWKIKKAILNNIEKLRNIKKSKKYIINSPKYLSCKAGLEKNLRDNLKLRKQNKYTN